MSVRSKQPSFSHTWRDFSENELKEILACETATAMKKYIIAFSNVKSTKLLTLFIQEQ